MTFIKRWLIRRCLLEKFVLNVKEHGFNGLNDSEEILKQADGFGAEAINYSFQWNLTKEGHCFWSKVDNEFKESYINKKCLT